MMPTKSAAPQSRPQSLEEIAFLAERVLETSPADETEIAWMEVRRGRAEARGSRVEAGLAGQRTVLLRVLDRGRVGSHRTGACELGELKDAVRMAVAQSRVREPLAGLPHLPAAEEQIVTGLRPEDLRDRRLARLEPAEAQEMLSRLLRRREIGLFDWTEAGVAVLNSRSVRRLARVTAAQLTVRCGRLAGAGRATAAARHLDDLDLPAIVATARSRHGRGQTDSGLDLPLPLVLAPEAAVELVDLLSREAFSAKAYHDGTSFLREHLGVQVFDRSLNLRDDGTDPAGIPFPFDLEGSIKRPVDLVHKGAPKTPTLDHRQAAVLGLPPTAHAIGGNDSQALNLFLLGGDATAEELLDACRGGLWIGALDRIEILEPKRFQFRARAQGVRRIDGEGRLARPVPDLWWEDSLLRALSNLRGLGREPARRLSGDGFLGGTSAPAVALGPVEGLTPAVRSQEPPRPQVLRSRTNV